ncbi:hypothetical protein [Paraferrimonas haliotis]|uniref:Uncharacterized protein n=1 Tax=Paraferrimonas haliotis TaxID=2013866 RepID=A0AA37TV98_9GAMM|nr:hypothetical protein [Paraferrimonas haliotis]GLS83290.1 hypothetical protein GCM10007894_12670 [Paraferrimonas haliotis]
MKLWLIPLTLALTLLGCSKSDDDSTTPPPPGDDVVAHVANITLINSARSDTNTGYSGSINLGGSVVSDAASQNLDGLITNVEFMGVTQANVNWNQLAANKDDPSRLNVSIVDSNGGDELASLSDTLNNGEAKQVILLSHQDFSLSAAIFEAPNLDELDQPLQSDQFAISVVHAYGPGENLVVDAYFVHGIRSKIGDQLTFGNRGYLTRVTADPGNDAIIVTDHSLAPDFANPENNLANFDAQNLMPGKHYQIIVTENESGDGAHLTTISHD